MTFDAWQLLGYFGTKPLDENERIFKSSNPKLDEYIKSGKLVYGRSTPHIYCAYDRGFYFQPILVECHLGDFLEKLSQEPSLISLNGIQGEKSGLRDHEGPLSLPYFPVHIIVNRTLFGPQRPREEEETWLGNLTGRRRAIAHELLFAKQYANFYDVTSDAMSQEVSTPTESDEEELMCPTDVIEKLLNTFETEHETHSLTAGAFVDADERFHKAYERVWLREYAVSKKVCDEQTIGYLEKGLRHHVRTNVGDIRNQISRITTHPNPDSKHFLHCLNNGHRNAAELRAFCVEIATQFKSNYSTVIVSVSRALDLGDGGGI